jgi:immune inhibitor A
VEVKYKLLLLLLVLALVVAAGVAATVTSAPPDVTKAVKSLGMFSATKWTTHYRTPNDDQILLLLKDHGISLAGPDARAKAVQVFRQEWAKRNPTTPNPKKLQKLLANERRGKPAVVTGNDFMSLAVPVEFSTTPETFDAYVDGELQTVTTAGPLHNQIPAPGPKDNNTIWYQDATPTLYNELYFGVGPDAGVVVQHPNLGTVDLRGNTMANYYLEQSEGKFVPHGEVYPKWLQAAHSEAWYGADNESGSNSNIRAADLVHEVVDAINADDPNFPWQQYDGDGNGIVDNFTVIHAGMGQEAGGGQQGSLAIWSHASAIDAPAGYLACKAGTHGADRDIYVREYSMDPENLDVGVISEEYGHAAFGLPDIYTTDYQASPANWAIMEAGSWNGILGGMQPAPFPLFFRYLVGWAKPVELDYTTGLTTAKVGQLSRRPAATEQGVKINLPDQVVDTANPMGTGKAWWSDRADLADFYLAHDFDLTGATNPIFSFASSWGMEQDYDYSYFEVSDDGGATWTKLPDMDGVFVTDGNGDPALNGEGQGTLRFDLSAYAGEAITLRLHYTSDVGVQWAGWFADDFALVDGATTLFSDDVEGGDNGWTTNHFVTVPLTRIYPMYYMAEWRNNSGFDRGLKYAYQTVYDNPATTEWQVDRGPYTVPGMLLWLRNGAYDFDYTLSDAWFNPPSYGPKHALLVVDSHYWPLTWDSQTYASGANVRISSRLQPSNATFTLQKTTPFTIRLGYDPATGDYVDPPLETKTFKPLPAVSQFHDSLGYYPGLWYKPDPDPDVAGLYFWEADASAVVPAKDNYTTKITWPDKSPAKYLYGYDMGDTILGSGDPRDSGVQYGINIAVLDKATNGSWGKIAVWNATTLVKVRVAVDPARARVGQTLMYVLKAQNLGPASQRFAISDPIPANTTYTSGKFYSRATKSIMWKGTVAPYQTKSIVFYVKVKRGTTAGTVIKNIATLVDDASGSTASAKTVVR